jgi:hypothetical protein
MKDQNKSEPMKVGIEEEKQTKEEQADLNKVIKKQIEFYFSDSNLYHDTYLLKLLNQSSKKLEVASDAVIEFSKLKKLLAGLPDSQAKLKVVRKAIAGSHVVRLSEDMKMFKRKQPFNKEEYAKSTQLEKRSIYIENFPETTTSEVLRTVLAKFGEILYLNMPKYGISEKAKGFVFVEYKNIKDAERAIETLNGAYPEELAYSKEGNSF